MSTNNPKDPTRNRPTGSIREQNTNEFNNGVSYPTFNSHLSTNAQSIIPFPPHSSSYENQIGFFPENKRLLENQIEPLQTQTQLLREQNQLLQEQNQSLNSISKGIVFGNLWLILIVLILSYYLISSKFYDGTQPIHHFEYRYYSNPTNEYSIRESNSKITGNFSFTN